MSGPANSPISDPTPYSVPEVPEAVKKIPQTDWDLLGKKRKYKQVNDYLEARKEFHRFYLPDGRAVKDATDEEIIANYRLAAVVIDEIENFQMRIQTFEAK